MLITLAEALDTLRVRFTFNAPVDAVPGAATGLQVEGSEGWEGADELAYDDTFSIEATYPTEFTSSAPWRLTEAPPGLTFIGGGALAVPQSGLLVPG